MSVVLCSRPSSKPAAGEAENVVARLVVHWLAIFLVVLIGASLGLGIRFEALSSVALFAVVLALLNVFVKPNLTLVTLPITCLTLGLFTLVIHGLLFWLDSGVVPGISVTDFWTAILGAILV